MVLECWQRNDPYGADSEVSLLQRIHQLSVTENRLALMHLTSCTFLQWNHPCVGDPLPGPVSAKAIDEFIIYNKDFQWNSLQDRCVLNHNETIKYCFYIQEYHSRYYWGGGCITKR